MSTDPDDAQVFAILDAFRIELPSWGFINMGTRFRVFPQPGTPRNVFERVEDAATVHRYTGSAPIVSLHIPWDSDDDLAQLGAFATERNLCIGAINSNTFQDEEYRLGSLAHPDAAVRRRALVHMEECCRIVERTGSHALKVWLADGTNYPGQDDFRRRKLRLEEAFREIHQMLPEPATLLIEYKFYEPAFYHTDIQDWGMAAGLCRSAGERARVVVDLGHHAHGVNIEQIVAGLLADSLLGAFDLNDRKYGDDDLIAGAINPFQLFLIFNELVGAAHDGGKVGAFVRDVAYMVDQSHNIEPKIPAMILTVTTLQEQWLRASLVDRGALRARQEECDILGAYVELKQAHDTDVRPMLERWRKHRGLPGDPLAAYLESGEGEERAKARADGTAAAWH